VASTPDGSVWLVSYTSNTIQQFRQGRITTSKLPPYSRSDTTRILSLYAGGNNHIWFGGSFKLAKGAEGKVSFIKVPDIEKGAMVHAIAQDTEATCGSRCGEATRVEDSCDCETVAGRFSQPCSSPTIPLPRSLWGSAGAALVGIRGWEVAAHQNEEFHVYSAKDGLPGGKVLAFASDRTGNIWIGSEGGLSRFDHGHFVTLTKKNGLPGIRCRGLWKMTKAFSGSPESWQSSRESAGTGKGVALAFLSDARGIFRRD